MNTKLHAVTDAQGRPIRFFMTAGQLSDYMGAMALLSDLPKADWLLGSRLIKFQSQKRTVAARAMAERKTIGHRS